MSVTRFVSSRARFPVMETDTDTTTHNVIFDRLLKEIHTSGIEICVTITADASVVRDWLTSALYFSRHFVHLKRLVVGLGVQWTGANIHSPGHILQLCIGRRCLIFQLARATAVPQKLRTFLLNPLHTFVGLWNIWDRQKLSNSRHHLEMERDPLDLRLYLRTEVGDNLSSLKEIMIERCLGFRIEPGHEAAVSDWFDEYLSDDQIAYATVRVLCAFLIGLKNRVWEVPKARVVSISTVATVMRLIFLVMSHDSEIACVFVTETDY
ncbi:hypothetical protein VNO80_29422 [Phaseolus coccineus]|uniref:Uncharacterized protein n=1 Tax=Phaseolus coccineus TaxID=3886 RepID=A0AAN9LAX7_PHACN